MLRKLCFTLILIIIFSFVSMPVLAAVDIYSDDTPATGQNILTITRPEGKETTYNRFYEICGVTGQENVRVEFLIFNEEEDKYEKLYDVNEESSWDDIGVFFAKEVELKLGTNKIRIVAYSTDSPDKKQISDFTIIVFKENIVDAIKYNILQLLDSISRVNSK